MKLENQLLLNRCPHCSISKPNLKMESIFKTTDHTRNESTAHFWGIYICASCGNVVTAKAYVYNKEIIDFYPSSIIVSNDIPDRAKKYLEQAIASIHAPSGAVMLCASSVDSMLKEKGYLNGSLYTRINKAVQENKITSEIEIWAHEIRLDANDERHADYNMEMPTVNDAKRIIDFTIAIAEYLFVLPAKVRRGINVNEKKIEIKYNSLKIKSKS